MVDSPTRGGFFSNPQLTISDSIGDMLMNPLGGMVNVTPGTTYQSMGDWGQQHYLNSGQNEGRIVPDGSYAGYVQSYPDLEAVYTKQREGMGGAGQLAPITSGGFKRKALSTLNPELERQRNLLDALVAGGDLKAPKGYTSPIQHEGNVPHHGFGADTYGYQAGLKAALSTQMGSPLLYSLSQVGKDEDPILTKIKKAAAKEAIRGYWDAPKDRSSYPYRYESEDINFRDYPEIAIDSGVYDPLFTVNDSSLVSTDSIEAILQNNPGILSQTNADTLQSFFNIPEETTVTPVGTDSGTVIVEDTPEGTILTDNTPVFNTPIVDPSTWLPDDHIDTMPVLDPFAEEESTFPGTIEDLLGDRLDYNAPFNELLNVRPETTPEEFDDFITSQILGVDIPEAVSSLPSGPEEMTEVFTEEDKAAEDEQKRINEIAAKAEQDRIRLEKQAEDARKRQLAHEKQAREARERADRIEREARERDEQIQADDRKAIARARREEEQRNKKAKAAADKKRQAVEAARLNALAAAAKKQAAAAKKREEENKKKQEAESQRLHKLNMEMLARMRRDREERARQQASMPKSWAFF